MVDSLDKLINEWEKEDIGHEGFNYHKFDKSKLKDFDVILTFENGLEFNVYENRFEIKGYNKKESYDLVLKYLVGLYESSDLFKREVIDRFISTRKQLQFMNDLIMDRILNDWDHYSPFTYEEAFKLKDDLFRSMVFNTIDIHDMIDYLGKNKIKTDGIEVKRKIFRSDGSFSGYENIHNIYETYEVDIKKLGVDDPVYAVRCICHSTNNIHWIWIEKKYHQDPLSAIASTFRIHENVIPHIVELKRQGDILLVEMGDVDIVPSGNIIPLSKEQYFNLLTVET